MAVSQKIFTLKRGHYGRVKTTLKEISLKFAKQYGGLNLIPGQKLEVTDVKKPLKTFVKSQKEVISMIMMMILTVIMK